MQLLSFLKKYWRMIVFGLIFTTTLIVRILAVQGNNIAFSSDQARDMLEIRQMAVLHSPKLIGPITDILGLYLGPFWYYFNLIPFIIGGGNPLTLVHFSIIIFHFFSIIVFIVLSKKNKTLGLFSSSLLLLSPIAFLTTRFSFNANAVFFFSALYPLFIFFKSKTMSMFEGILGGLILQLQAAIGILFFPISFFVHLKRDKNRRDLIPLTFGFLITLIPQIAFELSHRFLMTKALFTEIIGGSNFLGSKLSFMQILSNRYIHFISIFSGVSNLSVLIIIGVILTGIFISKRPSKISQFLSLNLKISVIFFVFFLLFPYSLKDWYLYGLVPFAIYSFASALATIGEYSRGKLISALIFCVILYLSILSNLTYLDTISRNSSNDPSNLNNMLITVDKVYENTSGQSFIVFSYLPSVYDYTYQYLFWWYGTKKYGYQPEEIAYLPNVPEYIKNNSIYWTKKKNTPSAMTFLIIQSDKVAPAREKDWRDKFTGSVTRTIDLPWDTIILKLIDSDHLRQ